MTVCVPLGNNPEKNRAIRGFGAELIEQGGDYEETVEIARALVCERGLHLVHSTNDPAILAGAADAVRLVLRTTHNLAEGGGAASFAGLRLLRDRLAGRKVAVVLSGSDIDADTLRRVVTGEI